MAKEIGWVMGKTASDKSSLHLLLVEDNPDDVEIMQRLFSRSDFPNCSIQYATKLDGAIEPRLRIRENKRVLEDF